MSSSERPKSVSMTLKIVAAPGVKRLMRICGSTNTVAISLARSRFCQSSLTCAVSSTLAFSSTLTVMQLLVGRLQLLLAGLELLARRAQLLVERLQLLVRRLQVLGRGAELHDGRLQLLVLALQRLLELRQRRVAGLWRATPTSTGSRDEADQDRARSASRRASARTVIRTLLALPVGADPHRRRDDLGLGLGQLEERQAQLGAKLGLDDVQQLPRRAAAGEAQELRPRRARCAGSRSSRSTTTRSGRVVLEGGALVHLGDAERLGSAPARSSDTAAARRARCRRRAETSGMLRTPRTLECRAIDAMRRSTGSNRPGAASAVSELPRNR